jgi:hypothetical protein
MDQITENSTAFVGVLHLQIMNTKFTSHSFTD